MTGILDVFTPSVATTEKLAVVGCGGFEPQPVVPNASKARKATARAESVSRPLRLRHPAQPAGNSISAKEISGVEPRRRSDAEASVGDTETSSVMLWAALLAAVKVSVEGAKVQVMYAGWPEQDGVMVPA